MNGNVAKFTAPREPSGRFMVGGPGRPKGALAKHSRTLLAQVKAMGPAAVQKLWEALSEGERWAVELVLSHVLPRDRALEWQGLEPEDIREAIKAGDVGSEEAARLTAALAKLGQLDDLEAIRSRLGELEDAVRNAR